jgi:hypothetical protein
METVNEAEEFVYRVCQKTFLSLWSYANPQGKEPGKELCDILVVCEPDIVIFSVKNIKLGNSGNLHLDWDRWRKKAIVESVKQIYGAERYVRSANRVIRKDGTAGLVIHKDVPWKIHRVAVAVGGHGKAPIEFGDFGKGFVHVFDEVSFNIIVGELDTIGDFVAYLIAKEGLYASGVATLFHGGEEDLLALYLHQGRTFPTDTDPFIVDQGLWSSVSQRDEVRLRKLADKDSYVWDKLIEELCSDSPLIHPEPGPSLTEQDIAVRAMARETRFNRRMLGQALRGFLEAAKGMHIRSRMLRSLSQVVYVFQYVAHGEDNQAVQAELGHRSFIAMGMHPGSKTVIGVSIEEWVAGQGCSSSLLYLHKEAWTDEDTEHMRFVQDELGYFSQPLTTAVHEDEYPVSGSTRQVTTLVDGEQFGPVRPGHRIGRNDTCPCGSGKKFKRCHGR